MNTVKVRVFVNVGSGGDWVAAGDEHEDDEDVKDSCYLSPIDKQDTQQGYWIEVELPVPPKKGQVNKESFNVTVTKD